LVLTENKGLILGFASCMTLQEKNQFVNTSLL
jgi:hypothetical protein